MATYYYFKSSAHLKTRELPLMWRLFPVGLVMMGVVFLFNAISPMVIYELRNIQPETKIISPVVLGETLAMIDYSNPQNWFPVAPQFAPRSSKITHYSLSIPKLKIEDATVQIGGDDLMASLIQYPGTALPGQFGNAVIFGHSVLPQFFNPKNYKTIFSTLPTLAEKDEILVSFDGVLYRYQVVEMIETTAEDVTVLEQRYDDINLSLLTCVPPGTYLRRLVVRARLIKYPGV